MYVRTGMAGIRRGLGQTCSPSYSPSLCAGAGGAYDGDAETCNCPGTPAASGGGLTLQQQQALCLTSSETTWDSSTNTCVVTSTGQNTNSLTAPLPFAPSANNCANNPKAGSYSDVNCPWWCLLPGGSNDSGPCYPCSNTCPAGTNFDTTNYVCTANPATTNCVGGVAGTPNLFGNIPMWAWIGMGVGVAVILLPRLMR
jgi:hypothetical protein